MTNEESKRRQQMLREWVLKLAEKSYDDDGIRTKAHELADVYIGEFRHAYSDFFPLITKISKNETLYSLDFLTSNLSELIILVEKDKLGATNSFSCLYDPLPKLNDHLNMEIARYNYYSQNEGKIRDLEVKNNQIKKDLDVASRKLSDATRKLNSSQTDLISVLSIFAAIVLTFSGSLSLLGNALTGMEKAPFLKAVFFVSLCGLIVFNTIFLMMYLVAKITGRNIYANCKSSDCTCNNGSPKCSGINRIRKRLPYVFWGNLLFLLFLLVSITLWILNGYFGFLPFE